MDSRVLHAPPPQSGFPFYPEQRDPCMISEEKEFCCYPHNPKKSENHWLNPIYLISHTMWKLRLRYRVSQHPPERQQPPAPDSQSTVQSFPSVLAWAPLKEAHPTSWLTPEKGWGAPKLGTIPPPHTCFPFLQGWGNPARVSFSRAKEFLSN